jgi:uncharacterized protein
VWFAAGLSALLTLWNNAVNVVRPRWAYVPTNLLLAVALVAAARRRGHSWDDLGLDPARLGSGLRWGAGAAAVVGAGLATASAVPALRPFLDDARVADADVAYEALVRIPLGTVVLEEVAFRGVLLAVLARRWSTRGAVLGSSAVFGLWHVVPTLQALRVNEPDASAAVLAAGVAGGVAVTAVGGVVFCLLRLRSGSVLAPVLAHVATNSFALVAASRVVDGA